MTPTEEVREAIAKFEGVNWINHGEPQPGDTDEGYGVGWVKFGVEKSELGWRTVEFLSWALNEDLKRAKFELLFFPVSPPPYLNEPGDSLSFALEMLDSAEGRERNKGINQIAGALNEWREEYWPECKPQRVGSRFIEWLGWGTG